MSSPRQTAGKRPRDAGMEGSTIVVPNKSNDDNDSSSSSIIIMLANACKQHLDQHEKDGTAGCTYHESEIPASCRKALDKLSRIIPKMEKAYNAGRNPKSVDVMHLCDFYLSVTQNNFCPAALKLFNYGRKPVEVITRVMSLLEHILSPNNRKEFKAQWRRPGLPQQGSFLHRLCHTAATLLGVISNTDSQTRICIFQDLVHTIHDLSVLIDSRYFSKDDVAPVEVVLFAETLQRDDVTDIALHVDSMDATKLLQAAILKILPLWVSLCRLKQLESFPDPTKSVQTLAPDSGFATFLWSDGHLDMFDDATVNLHSVLMELVCMPVERMDYCDGLRRYAAVQVMQALLQDFQTVGAPELHIVLDFSTSIAKAALDTLKTHQDTKVVDALADCIRECILIPPRIDGWTRAASQRAIRRVTCPLFLDCVPLLSDALTISAQILGTAILGALGEAFNRKDAHSSSLSLRDYPRSIDPDFLSALFDLMEERCLIEHAVRICALAVDFAEDVFGSLDVDSVISKILDQCNKEKCSIHPREPSPERTRKRQRFERVGARTGDSPAKRSRSQKSGRKEVRAHRSFMVQSCVVDLLSFAMLACNKKSSTETDSTTSRIDALTRGPVVVSNAVRMLVLSQSLNRGNGLEIISESLVAYMEGLFQGLISMDSDMTQLACNQVERIAIELSTSVWTKMYVVPGSKVERLLELADSIALSRKGFEKITKHFLVDFPFAPLDIHEGPQISRIRLLRYKLNCPPTKSNTSNDAMQTTVELLRDASLHHTDPFVRLLLWQVGAWLLRTSTDIERHLMSACDNRDFSASKLIKFLISTPFSDDDVWLRTYAARELGRSLVSNPLIRAHLLGAASNGHKTKPDGMLNLSAGLEETRLFKDVDGLLYQHCRIPQSQLSFTVGLSVGSNSDDGKSRMCENIGYQRSAVRSLVSLFESFFAWGNKGELMAKSAFLRLIRLWVFFGQNQMHEASFFTFGELCRGLARTCQVRRTPFILHTAPATFRDVLFPCSSYFACSDEGNTNPLYSQLESQCQMLYTLIEKVFSVGDFGTFVFSGGPTINDVEESLDACLPNALAQLVIEKDYDVLRSLTAFKRYVMNRHREAMKGKRTLLASINADLTTGTTLSKSKLWARDLEEQTMKLCTASNVVERLLPLLLMLAGPEEDLFFTKHVLMNRFSLPKILQTRGQIVLKGLITEFGRSDEAPKQAIWALKRAAVAKALSEDNPDTNVSNTSRGSNDSAEDSVSSWVSENFMHLLVNLVQSRWREKSPRDKIQSLRCLRAMLGFLKSAGSSQYLPQIMSTVNASLGGDESDLSTESIEIRFLAIQILDRLVRLVWEDSREAVGDNLTSIVVTLIPVLSGSEEPGRLPSSSNREVNSVTRAVSLLKWLTEGDRGGLLKDSFKNIPFLPQTPALDPVRTSLEKIGLDFNDLRLTMTEASLSRISGTSDTASTSAADKSAERVQKMKTNMRDRLQTVCRLLNNENSSIRLHALRHLISLLQSNRDLFHILIDTEETSRMSRFVTVCSSDYSGYGKGVVSELVGALLDRCALETNRNIQILVAKAVGEVGAISHRRLQYGPAEVVSNESDVAYTWRLSRPPWKVSPVHYQLFLLTDQLVGALKAAPSSLDHQKIAFTIQEVLALANSGVYEDADRQKEQRIENDPSASSGMSNWLKEKLLSAGVLQIVEPFLNSEFCEREPSIPGPPPFFSTSRCYYQWMSSWCRFMIYRSKSRSDSDWCNLLHACRLALRTQSGLGIAEFLLPIIVLDSICSGTTEDEACVINEMKDALLFCDNGDSLSAMNRNERQKAVSTVFSVIGTLRYWSERDTEDRHRGNGSIPDENYGKTGGWPADEAIMRIDDVLRKLPLDLQARAAAEAGMHARSLRLLEMASRESLVDTVFDKAARRGVISTRSLSSGSCDKNSIDLFKDNLVTLGEYETIAALSEENLDASAISKALDGIRQKESSKDWSGALQDYERAHHLLNDPEEGISLMQGTLNCLLELGQFESVLRQVKGSSISFGGKQSDSLVPFAVEASWRLGRWDILKELVDEKNSTVIDNGLLPHNVQVEVGQAMLAINEKNASSARTAIDRAREAVMAPLATTARESYSRAYSHIVKLHSLREIEDAVPIICNAANENDLATFVADCGGWKRRMDVADPSYTMDLAQSRLALARIVGNHGLEAELFLSIGRRARKDQQYSIAASALAQAEASFDIATKSPTLNAQRCALIIEQAKLKHETGESSASLRLLNMDDIELMLELDDASRENEILRRVCAMLPRDAELGMSKDSAAEVFRKSALLSTKWMIEGGVKDCSRVIQRFTTIHKVAERWEKGHFQFAKYIESVLELRVEALHRKSRSQSSTVEDMRQTCLEQDRACQKYLQQAVKHFVKALVLDLKHLFQALPRLLSLWFEFSALSMDGTSSWRLPDQTQVSQAPPGQHESLRQLSSQLKIRQNELTKYLASAHHEIQAQAFYSALPQLISRIMDSNGDLKDVIRSILSRVLGKFPEQAMWPLAWLRQSKDGRRSEMGELIFKEAENHLATQKAQGHFKLLVASKGLHTFLQELAKYPVSDGKKTMSVRPWKGEVPLSSFVPPIQAALSPSFAPVESERNVDPFPRHIPRMKDFSRSIMVMVSKARPKKLKATAVMIQSNPRIRKSTAEVVGEFHFLVKQEAKGDLRKDARVQDLNNVINRLLSTDRSAQHRRLRLRTFAVTCLSEDSGILEWVPKTNSLRNLVMESYNPQVSPFSSKRRGRRMTNAGDAMLRATYEKKCQEMFFVSGDLKKAAALFDELLLKANPPLLYWWFVHHFQSPHSWYEARTRFTLSAAAWSAVGHVIGLGDRHSENILVDTTCGEMVHVDFDCIFDKGLNLPKPEVVPFRLTPNMVDAFGPVGADGIYTESLKDAMGTLRSNRDTLLSVLEPFIKDPVIDWKRSRTQQKLSQQERQFREAKRSIKVIDERLQGVYNLKNPNFKKFRRTDLQTSSEIDGMSQYLPLSIDGQVHKMISEATSRENLVQLYVGWMPWI